MIPTLKIDHFFYSLKGQWAFDRYLNQHLWCKGKADFCEIDQSSYLYEEEGMLLANKYTLQSQIYQKFSYRLIENKIDVYFETSQRKGDFYLRLQEEKQNLKLSGIHICGKDQYKYDVLYMDDIRFKTETHILGPKKCFEILTLYTKQNLKTS